MLEAALYFVVVLGSGTVAGTLFGVARAVVPTLHALPGPSYVRVHQLLDRRFDPFMPWVTRVTMAAVLVLLVLPVGWEQRWPLIAGLAASVLLAVISDTRNVPINKRISQWDPEDHPEEWESLRSRWGRANTVRTVFALAAFASYLVAVMYA